MQDDNELKEELKCRFKKGDIVRIIDYSEVNQTIGKVWSVQKYGNYDGYLILVEVDCTNIIDAEYDSYLWPVDEYEIVLVEKNNV